MDSQKVLTICPYDFRMTRTAFGSFVLGLALVVPTVARAEGTTIVDPNHTQAFFSAKHLVLSTVQGVLPVKDAKAELAAGGIPTSIQAIMDVTKIDTHNEKRDNDLRSDRFLDAGRYPEVTFKSTKVVPGSNGAFEVEGTITIRGVTKPLTLNGKVEGAIKDQQGRTHYGYALTGSLDRTQYGVGASIPAAVVGTEIAITIQAETIVQ